MLYQMLIVVGVGIAGGLLLSLLAARTVSSLLFGLSPFDPATMLGAAVILTIVVLASGLKPAWRAAQINPIDALRME